MPFPNSTPTIRALFYNTSPRRLRLPPSHASTRPLSSGSPQPRSPSPHARFYTDYVAGMIPVALLGSAVYIGLRTWQQHLAQERFLEEAHAHVQELKAEVIALREKLRSQPAEHPASNTPTETKKRSGWLPW